MILSVRYCIINHFETLHPNTALIYLAHDSLDHWFGLGWWGHFFNCSWQGLLMCLWSVADSVVSQWISWGLVYPDVLTHLFGSSCRRRYLNSSPLVSSSSRKTRICSHAKRIPEGVRKQITTHTFFYSLYIMFANFLSAKGKSQEARARFKGKKMVFPFDGWRCRTHCKEQCMKNGKYM